MSGEEISVLSLEGRYYNCRERGTIMILDTLRLTISIIMVFKKVLKYI